MNQQTIIRELSERIEALERENKSLKSKEKSDQCPVGEGIQIAEYSPHCEQRLSNQEIARYSRQLLVSNGFGVKGQKKLLESSALIIGAGGIGSTVILYLAACGVGNLTIVDFDHIDVSNLHRQVIHATKDVGVNKAESAARVVSALNPTIRCETVKNPLTSENALELVSKHDIVVDASDNPQTRYLVNDACVLSGTPLVSGSAMGTEGQLTVYNYQDGPCYRCLYPKVDAKEGAKSCSDNGVLGPVPGLIGVLQSLEAIKILTGIGDVVSNHLLMYDSLRCSFLRIKKPNRQANCHVCGPSASIKSMKESAEASMSARGPSCALSTSLGIPCEDVQEVSVTDYDRLRKRNEPHVLLDVRVPEQVEICAFPGSVNIPLKALLKRIDEVENHSDGSKAVYCICRRGIFSVAATRLLSKELTEHPKIKSVINIKGGLDAWRRKVDPSFPTY